MSQSVTLPYRPSELPRELKKHYISASDAEIRSMLASIGVPSLDALFEHLPRAIRMEKCPAPGKDLSYEELAAELLALSKKNRPRKSLVGKGLADWAVPAVLEGILGIRELTTSYTPYQPERSQGTLATHWIYQCLMAQLTGFEAVNSSLYDRSTALFEALLCARRATGKNRFLIAGSIFEKDREVLRTLAKETTVILEFLEIDAGSGRMEVAAVRKALAAKTDFAGFAYAQVNGRGVVEDVHGLTDAARELGVKAIGVFDPLLVGAGGLVPPAQWGAKGCDMIVGEGQHLALAPNFGGPGLGIFGIRFNEGDRQSIRSTAGRFVGKAKDLAGRDCKVMVLSTREQHIRREKANSNICSNEAFIATLAGAALLAHGDDGMASKLSRARANAELAWNLVTACEGVQARHPSSAVLNEFTLQTTFSAKDLRARLQEAGFDVAELEGEDKAVVLTFTDRQSEEDVRRLGETFRKLFPKSKTPAPWPALASTHLRADAPGLPHVEEKKLLSFYKKLASQNVSPDSSCYPLGSCTMKYNPYINDWAAGLSGFQEIHPEASPEDSQGNLEVIWRTQEIFKEITGLAAVTTQPVAGAQGELVGLKLFQAYHRDRNDLARRLVLIPRSAHGTNPATATYAGFEEEAGGGVVIVEAATNGEVDLQDLKRLLAEHGPKVAGLMVTNPNTSGLFETNFREMADLVHAAGGLVYMDGANMNAICGWADLGKMGVDAVHNNTHKTWSIPHGGGGPGDAFVAVSEKLVPFLPGHQVVREGGVFRAVVAPKSIGRFHRHWGNFAHKVRALAYLSALGTEGVRRVSALAVLSARYLQKKLESRYPLLPAGSEASPRMHEFILTLPPALFEKIEKAGVPKANVIGRFGKLFLDFGFHAPTVSFPEVFGLMIEPTESYTQGELDRFAECVIGMFDLVDKHPEVLLTVPHFTPIDRVDEVGANRSLVLSERITDLPAVLENRLAPGDIGRLSVPEIAKRVLETHRAVKP